MKKHILKLVLCAALIGTVTSCRDALDIIQEGELSSENVFKSPEDMKRFLDGDIYRSMGLSSTIRFSALFTDETGIGPAYSGFTQDIHQFFVDTTTGEASSLWVNNYYVINRVLFMLEGAKLINPSTAELEAYNSYIAEARTLRAFAYIQLLQHFSTDMSDPEALGVILLDRIPNVDDMMARTKNADIYAVIESDLNFAESNIVDRDATQYYVSKNMISALKARYYLYTKNYALAKQYAQRVVSESGLNLTLATPVSTNSATPDTYGNNWHRSINAYSTINPYMKMLQDTDRGEMIFSLARPITGSWEGIAGLFATNASAISGSGYDMGRQLFNIVRGTDGDIRKYAYIDPTSRIAPGDTYLTMDNYRQQDALVIDKYPGKTSVPLRNDIKVFRISEMYFILAECAAQEDNFAAAADFIYKVRQARNFKGTAVLPTYGNRMDALKDILKERRVELAFEGHRFIDLKRVGPVTGETMDRSIVDAVTKEIPLSIPMGDYRWTLPIPRSELQANSVIQQNPGYKTTP